MVLAQTQAFGSGGREGSNLCEITNATQLAIDTAAVAVLQWESPGREPFLYGFARLHQPDLSAAAWDSSDVRH